MSLIRIPGYAAEVLHELEHGSYKAYAVGGCVRDSLLGQKPADWDVCTDATPEEMLQVFRKWRVFATGLKHGTVTVRSHGHNVEVTTFRTDGTYSDNRHPDAVHFVSSIRDDLARRDFTINAMAYNDREGLVDAFGGQQDLEKRILRCVGEPDLRFREDSSQSAAVGKHQRRAHLQRITRHLDLPRCGRYAHRFSGGFCRDPRGTCGIGR